MSTATSPDSRSPWIPFPPAAPDPTPAATARTRTRLLCFPCAGQGASVYRPWQRLLAPDIDVVPVQLPGRESRATEEPYRDMDSLMEGLLPVLRGQTEGPYALFGHSLGAMVAFEAARRLEAEGRTPLRLTVAAQRPAHVPSERRPLHDLPHAAFMTMLGLYGQVPVELFDDRAALDLAATGLRADFALVETYLPAQDPPLACPLTALAGLADTSIPPASMRGWKALTEGGFTFRPVPGGHFFVNERTEELMGLLRPAPT